MLERNPAASIRYLVGIDEAGRGPLAGPVAVGVAVMPIARQGDVEGFLLGIRDSKQLSRQKREEWAERARVGRESGLVDYAVSLIGAAHIDKRGIVSAVRLGIKRSLLRLAVPPTAAHILLDGGLQAPKAYCFQKTIAGGDGRVSLIALASILAKVRRDRYMERLSWRHPEYGFEQHKGYGTAEHIKRIRRFGTCIDHRRSFIHI